MEQLLPKVRQGTFDSLVQTLADEYYSDKEFIKSYTDVIYKTNPIALQMIMKWVDDLEGAEYINTIMGMLALYRLLESEAEAIQFEKEMEEAGG